MEKKYFINFVFENDKTWKKVPRSEKSWMDCISPEEHIKDFKLMFEKSVALIGDKNNVCGFYTVYEQTEDGNSLADFVMKIVYRGNEGIKYLNPIETKKEKFIF